MRKMFLFFSHQLTEEQKLDAKKEFGIEETTYLPSNLQEIFSNIPSNLEKLDDYIEPLKDYLQKESSKDDIVLIQGDFGATFLLVKFAKELGLKTVYATTKRVVVEVLEENDKKSKKSIFKHGIFREYE